MSGYEPRGHFGRPDQFGPGSGEQESDEQRRPDQRRREYNNEIYPQFPGGQHQAGQGQGADQFPSRPGRPAYRAPDQVPTESVPRPAQFSPYQNPVMRPQPDTGTEARGTDPRSRQPWKTVPREAQPRDPQPSRPLNPEPRVPEFRERQPRDLGTRQPETYPARSHGLRGAEPFWYILGCIAAGAAYFGKLPAKKAACEILTELHRAGDGPGSGYRLGGAEKFWYVLLCLPFGGAYFAKVSAKKALWEMITLLEGAPDAYRDALARALYGAA